MEIKEDNDLISVIIPVYNVEKYLTRCAESVINQTYNNLEIIFIDDGSTDESGKICDMYAKQDKRVKVVHKENGGLSSARNAGLDIARGHYIGFVDSDDYIDLNMYESMFNSIKKYKTNIACVGIIREDEQNGFKQIIRCPNKETEYSDEESIEEILYSRNIGISVWSKLFEKTIFEKIRFPVGETNEDACIMIDLMEGKKVVHTGIPLYHYLVREGSITNSYKEKSAQFSFKNAKKIVDGINEKYPNLIDVANIYLSNTLFKILISYLRQKQVIDPLYKKYFTEFKKTWKCLIKSKELSISMKIKVILVRLHLFRIMYELRMFINLSGGNKCGRK